MLLTLLCGFLLQTLLVYTDVHDTVPLGEQAIAGRRLWHQNNCQTCHQFHGFGGFLGPDLTNVAVRLDRSALAEQLIADNGQMPLFVMDENEVDAIWAFLAAMNETGQGQARNPNLLTMMTNAGAPDGEVSGDSESTASISDDTAVSEPHELASLGGPLPVSAPAPAVATTPGAALAQVIDESGDETVAAGFALFRGRNCLTCHVFFARSSIGAPDLSLSGRALSDDELKTVLADGRPPRMPLPALSAPERTNVLAFIRFMAEHRAEALGRVVEEPGSFWLSLPWWEFE